MTWTGQFYPYEGTSITSNLTISGANPALELVGTETGGGTTELLEIAGGTFILNNVIYNTATSKFNLVNSAKAGSGMFVANSGTVTMYGAPSATAPWTTWPQTLWGTSATGSLNITDINTQSQPLTIEATNITHTLPNTVSGGLTVANSTLAYEPYIAVEQNISGGGLWSMATTSNQFVIHNTPFGGTSALAAVLTATGGAGNSSYLELVSGVLPPFMGITGGTLASNSKCVIGTASMTVTNGAAGATNYTVTLTGNAIFTSSASYYIQATPGNGITGWSNFGVAVLYAANASGSQFTLVASGTGGTATGAQTLMVDFLAIGY
jgi:hypothetical protein